VFIVNLKKIQDLPELPNKIKDYYNIVTSRDITYYALPIGVYYAIDLELGERPLFRPLYNLSIKELVVLREYLN
jgi:hypothetical protein